MIKLIECPRDAMQGIHNWIPTDIKVEYLQQLLKVGYHTLDCGSFVSPKAVPQMKDTAAVLDKLNLSDTKTKLLVIIANIRGANDACKYEQIEYLGFPFSISQTFQQRNTNSTIEQSFERVQKINEIAQRHSKSLLIYISMGFGNPYDDPYGPEIAEEWVSKLASLGISVFSLSDTVGVGNASSIEHLFKTLVPRFPEIEFGAHLHTAPHNWREKIEAAYRNGCNRFDTAIHGYGGCPMAQDDLIGNMPTEHLINLFGGDAFGEDFNISEFETALRRARKVFV
ncbi:MAG: hydroxymethylglutaryl-CoA lyase [Chitinophagales bacterium]|nr:hydroxymethylglutaryl-CoA lyase [Chitinophagales bacterium]